MKKAVLLVSALLGALALAPAARADACPGETSQPFASYGDPRDYTLAPGGDFENGAPGWELRGDAELEARDGDTVLELEPGDVAISPEICVTRDHPHIRMFAAAEDRTALKVKVHFDSAKRSAGWVFADSEWAPTREISLFPEQFELDPLSGVGMVRVSFRAAGVEEFQLDDVWVDPRRRS